MNLSEAANGPAFDAIIIGGGINGSAIAAECARRGLRVAMLEREDFGFGTTWRSTKLIHGGLRYLEHGDLRLVFESLRERAWLLRAKPHLVVAQRFILPMLPWTRRPAWQLRAGLGTYDILATGGRVPRHQGLSHDEMFEAAPFLTPLATDGFAFFDARALSAERLTLELALLAESRGAFISNHTEVERIEVAGGRVCGVRIQTAEGASVIPARAVVNAAGPWVDAVNAVIEVGAGPLLGVTRGTHIAVELDGPLPTDAIFSSAREDGRVFFAVPQDQLLLIGTTDVRFDGAPGDVRPTPADVEYLLREANALLPGLAISADRVRYAYAGLRPLQRVAGGPEAAITRRHSLIDHGQTGGPAGLLSVIGGKLSTFRPLAREVAEYLGKGRPIEVPAFRIVVGGEVRPLLLPARARQRVYGPAWSKIAAAGETVLCDVCGMVRGEIVHAVSAEHATTVSDVILRRSGTGWLPQRGFCCAEAVAVEMASLLAWTVEQRRAEFEQFAADARFHLPTPSEILADGGVEMSIERDDA